jgi:hypothetical protein
MSRLYRAYVGLLFAPAGKDGMRTIALTRYGAFEVRLVEFGSRCAWEDRRRGADASSLWIELYRRDTQSSLDRCRCHDLDEAENVAEQLLSRAQLLHRSGAGSLLPLLAGAPSLSPANLLDSNWSK